MPRRRDFGCIFNRPGRPGIYCRFEWQGRRVTRVVSTGDKKLASLKLATLRGLLERGADLQTALHDVFGDVGGTRATVRELMPHFLRQMERRWKATTTTSNESRAHVLCAADWAGHFVGEIRPEMIRRWIETRLIGETAPSTINRDVSLLSRFYRWSVDSGYVNENPVKRIERLSEKGRAREIYLTGPESRALIDSAPPILSPVLSFAIGTGCRMGEIRFLRWRSIDHERKTVTIEAWDAKSGHGRTIPLTDDLADELAILRARRPGNVLDSEGLVFINEKGLPWTKHALQYRLSRIAKGCRGIDEGKRSKVGWHVLRHTAGSLMAQAGIPLFEIGRILGHSSPTTTARYAHHAPDSGRKAVEAIAKAIRPAANGS